jgi:hypothetical protein
MSRQIIGKILGWDVSATEITCGSEVYWLGVFDHLCIPGRFDSAALVWKRVEDCLNANKHPVKEAAKRLPKLVYPSAGFARKPTMNMCGVPRLWAAVA